MRDNISQRAAVPPGGQEPPTAQPDSAPEHPQSHTESHQPHDEVEARRPPSRLALGGFLLALVLFGAALSWWGVVPGAPLYTGAP